MLLALDAQPSATGARCPRDRHFRANAAPAESGEPGQAQGSLQADRLWRVTGPCDKCATTTGTVLVAAAFNRGAAYVFRVGPGLPVPGAIPMCQQCFWGTAVYEAHRQGFDVHTHHPLTQPCPRHCLTRLGGRRIQVELFVAHAADPVELYRQTKRWDGLRARGTLPLNGVRTKMFYDLRTRQPFYEPITSVDKVRDLLRYRQVLEAAYVPEWSAPHLTASFRCFESARTAPGGVLTMPGADEPELEQHAVALWDIDEQDSIIFRNSWGVAWGDRGYGQMPRSYFDAFWVEAWLIRNAAVGLSPETAHRLAVATKTLELKRAWMLPNPAAKKAQRGEFDGVRLVNYSTVSFESECLVDVVEARNGYGLRLGWVHVFHPPGGAQKATSEIRELFVWPAFRRQGIGSLLEDLAASLARSRNSSSLRTYLHEADGHVAVRAAGRRFGLHRGYSWQWRHVAHPRLVAVGERTI